MSPWLKAELGAIAALAPAGCYIGIRMREGKADIVINTYPPDWQQRYQAMSYRLRDPTVAWAFAHEGAVRWSQLGDIDTADIFADAARHGLAHGIMIATGEITARTLGGFARSDRPFTCAEIDRLRTSVQRMHKRARLQSITMRQVQALRLIARGTPYAIAADQLNISESALKARIASARSNLGARTVPEAIRIAQGRGLI